VEGSWELGRTHSGLVRFGRILKWLSDRFLFKKGSIPWSWLVISLDCNLNRSFYRSRDLIWLRMQLGPRNHRSTGEPPPCSLLPLRLCDQALAFYSPQSISESHKLCTQWAGGGGAISPEGHEPDHSNPLFPCIHGMPGATFPLYDRLRSGATALMYVYAGQQTRGREAGTLNGSSRI
jgi:hypothetical protein